MQETKQLKIMLFQQGSKLEKQSYQFYEKEQRRSQNKWGKGIFCTKLKKFDSNCVDNIITYKCRLLG